MTSTTEKPKPKRRWHQFSLRTLLIVFVISTVAVGWIGGRVRQARLNRDQAATSEKEIKKAVAAIEKMGGGVTSAYEERRPQTWLERLFDDPGGADDPVGVLAVTRVHFGGRVEANVLKLLGLDLEELDLRILGHLKALTNLEELDLRKIDVTDAGLEHLKTMKSLQTLILGGDNFADAGLEHLKGLTNLQSLNLSNTNITDAGLEHLKGLTNLRILDLSSCNITDAGLEHLKGIKSLQQLILNYTNVTDAGLEHLRGLKSLQSLLLVNNNITDAGLEHLKGLKNLESLFLNSEVTDAGLEDDLNGPASFIRLLLFTTKVTGAGVKKLQQALPNCRISR